MIKDTEKKIHDAAIQFIQDIRNREKQLIEELQNIYGKDCMSQIENKKELSTQVDSLRSTCNLTDVILQGKDIELLLLKKEVQEKLQSLSNVEIKNLPSTVNKKINYIAGSIDFGFIQDMDRPLLSRMRIKKQMGSASDQNDWPMCVEKETQTETEAKSSEKKNFNKVASDSDEDSDDEDEDTSDESDDESDEEDDKPELVDSGVQTEQHDSSSDDENEDSSPEMKDEAMMTDEIQTAEIGVNTRSRSLGNQRNRSSPGKETGEDNSLAARRRRRRERAQTTGVATAADDNADDSSHDDSYSERRKNRSRMYMSSTTSVEGEDNCFGTPVKPSKHYV